ncbi:MAG: sugar phosphate nucleotidyltransferase [Candidatus Calescibacterium sp.]
MNEHITPVILSAGKVDETLIPIVGEICSGLIPVGGKPSIFHILDKYIDLGFKNVCISVGYQKEKLEKVVRGVYGNKLNLFFVPVDYTKKPGNSLLELVEKLGLSNVLVTLADTIYDFSDVNIYEEDENFILLGKPEEKIFSRYWSKATVANGYVSDVYEKDTDVEDAFPIAGVYFFKNIHKYVNKLDRSKNIELTDIIKCYIEDKFRIKAVITDKWIDVGHIFTYYNASRKLLNRRFFNCFEYDNTLGTIRKFSKDKEKMRNEILWYLNLPERLKILTPRIISYDLDTPYVQMEYYGYPTLAELYIYGDLPIEIWIMILEKLFGVLKIFMEYKGKVDIEDYIQIYYKKTIKRVSMAMEHSEILRKLFSYKYIVINGESFRGWNMLESKLEKKIYELFHEDHNCIIHGDLCFSNILFDLNTGIFKLLDPRGNFGSNIIYGDIKYDIAKLRHSIRGLYDFIVNDFFSCSINENRINIEFFLFNERNISKVQKFFDSLIEKHGFSIDHIKFIEGLLFISMLPLHSDNPNRQIAQFAQGILLLNDVIL